MSTCAWHDRGRRRHVRGSAHQGALAQVCRRIRACAGAAGKVTLLGCTWAVCVGRPTSERKHVYAQGQRQLLRLCGQRNVSAGRSMQVGLVKHAVRALWPVPPCQLFRNGEHHCPNEHPSALACASACPVLDASLTGAMDRFRVGRTKAVGARRALARNRRSAKHALTLQ